MADIADIMASAEVTYTPKSSPALPSLDKIILNLEGISGKHGVEVGWFPGTKYPERGEQVADVAAIQEYVNDEMHIPPRPFLRPCIKNNKVKWKRFVAKRISDGIAHGGVDIDGVMGILGEVIAGDLKQAILDVHTPPLAKVTIERRRERWSNATGKLTAEQTKQLTKPLIDTGLMINSIQVHHLEDD
jgi:hypothetical protein